MMQMKHWKVDVFIDEREGRTHAEARLIPQQRVTLAATGEARVSPRDADVPEIGDDLAVARALRALAQKLLQATAADIEEITDEDVELHA